MQTEPAPVESPKRPPLPDTLDPPVTADDLEDVTIRVVRLDQLAKPPAPPEPPPAPQCCLPESQGHAVPAVPAVAQEVRVVLRADRDAPREW